ncbi:hypothetical protein GCM10009674_06070 [Nesterenkonia xinjiangensis]
MGPELLYHLGGGGHRDSTGQALGGGQDSLGVAIDQHGGISGLQAHSGLVEHRGDGVRRQPIDQSRCRDVHADMVAELGRGHPELSTGRRVRLFAHWALLA